MPVINGQKFACDSCVKGHRVSNCNHYERELKLIAPKGRPVKQCDHCRTARKSKSHHAKCDCGSRKERKEDSPKADLRKEDSGCCCHKGEKCECGGKTEGFDSRFEKALGRPTPSVKSKPSRLTNSPPDSKLTVFSNGHHAPVHRNNSAQTSGVPYKIPRPHTLHGNPAFVKVARGHDNGEFDSSFSDDVFGASNSKMYSLSSSGSNSNESLQLANPDYPLDFSPLELSKSTSNGSFEDLTSESNRRGMGWIDTSLSTVPEDIYASMTTSPNFAGEFEWPAAVPSAMSEYFTSSELPLISPEASTFAQTISHSEESNYAPGLTSGSSAVQSDIGDGFWQDTVQVRGNNDLRWRSTFGQDYGSGFETADLTRASTRSGLSTSSQSRHLSDSSATTAFHLGSLGTEPSSSSDDNDYAIMIPNGDDSDEWGWQSELPAAQNGSDAKEYSWLIDS